MPSGGGGGGTGGRSGRLRDQWRLVAGASHPCASTSSSGSGVGPPAAADLGMPLVPSASRAAFAPLPPLPAAPAAFVSAVQASSASSATVRKRASSAPPVPVLEMHAMSEVWLPLRGSGGERDGPLDALQDDLEAFFEEVDSLRSAWQGGGIDALRPGLEAADFASLRRVSFASASLGAPRGQAVTRDCAACGPEEAAECAVCLSVFCAGDVLIELPCDPRHRLHEHCARSWLSRSSACPLCRRDARVGALPPAAGADEGGPGLPRGGLRPLAGNTLSITAAVQRVSRTRGGGTLLRFEPAPPPGWERPVYIPSELWHLAQYFEVSYPGRGEARIWRVPSPCPTLGGEVSSGAASRPTDRTAWEAPMEAAVPQ
mmetsp:Transcript_165798/g.532418  ORF Transcript_165798/g.532418 Transcript_165798/m.532418 type:complete len:373 (-) Transcript_165798:97-1215(-)